MNWLSFLAALIGLARDIMAWAASANSNKTLAVKALRTAIKASKQDVNHAKSIQDHLRSELDAHPERLRQSDGFRRE